MIGLEGEWHLPNDVRIRGTSFFLPSLTDLGGDRLLRSELEVTVPIVDPLAAKFRMRNVNDNNPSADVGDNKFTTNVGLSLQF